MLISAFLPVYNEEKRIEYALASLEWCDEIILLDKYSTDHTVELARKYGEKVKVFFMKNTEAYDSGEWDYMMEHCQGKWIIRFTASDIIHPVLAKNIISLISAPSFDYDIINVPFRRYVLGLESNRSPWYSKVCPMIFRKSVLSIDKNNVHGALCYSGRTYSMDNHEQYCMYHLTHETVDIMMSRHLRYWRGEINGDGGSLKSSFMTVLKETARVLFYRKPYLKGWDGVMLMFAYVTYYMMSFVYRWEQKRGNAAATYQHIRDQVTQEWSNSKK